MTDLIVVLQLLRVEGAVTEAHVVTEGEAPRHRGVIVAVGVVFTRIVFLSLAQTGAASRFLVGGVGLVGIFVASTLLLLALFVVFIAFPREELLERVVGERIREGGTGRAESPEAFSHLPAGFVDAVRHSRSGVVAIGVGV